MAERGTQQDYWNQVAAPRWEVYTSPLVPNEEEIDFQKRLLVPGGNTLILGATRELCSMATEVSSTVTAVDFSLGVIDKLRTPNVEYINANWFGFFAESDRQYDNIITDGGLLCIEFPTEWHELAAGIRSHLRPQGIFGARVYVSEPASPASVVADPNDGKFIKQDALAADNWMVTPTHADYEDYDVRYAKPPKERVLEMFSPSSGFNLLAELLPAYDGGEHFPSLAWRRTI